MGEITRTNGLWLRPYSYTDSRQL